MGAGKEETGSAESSCDYAGRFGQVTITLQKLPASLNLATETEHLKAAIPGSQVREVTGIGSMAFFLDVADEGTQLHVISREHDYLLVSVLGFGPPAQVSAAAETMARKGLERM